MIRIATAPVSWGIWEMTIDRPDLIGPELYLETIVDMGYTATETGPPGYFAPNGAAAVEKAARYGVELIATFLPLRLDDAEGFEEDLQPLDRVVEDGTALQPASRDDGKPEHRGEDRQRHHHPAPEIIPRETAHAWR